VPRFDAHCGCSIDSSFTSCVMMDGVVVEVSIPLRARTAMLRVAEELPRLSAQQGARAFRRCAR
jgi:hypothetical protein